MTNPHPYWIVWRKGEPSLNRDALNIASDEDFDVLRQEAHEEQPFGFDVEWPLTHQYS
jgi:hypothetical protein